MKISRNNNIESMPNKNVQNKKNILTTNMKEKLAITVFVIMLALFALLFKIYKIQSENSDKYNQKVLSQQRYDSRDIPYRRGDILDRNGTYLATSDKVYNLILDPFQINSGQDNFLEPTIDLLNEVFGYDKDSLRELLVSKSDSHYIRYDRKLAYEKKEEFEKRRLEVNNEYINSGQKQRVYGVWFEDSYLRKYPYDSLACNVIGFSLSDGSEGSGGIEQYYNDELIGTAGREYGYLNDESNLERVIKSATNGNTIVSTIDVNIQNIVERNLKKWEEETGSKTAACIVMNPNNGEILAMATNRYFDLNDPRNISRYYPQEEIDAMDEKQRVEAYNNIWRNFCVSDTYEPGSPSKIFTVAAAMEEGYINGNEVLNCDGFQNVGGWKIRCVKRTGHGNLSISESIMQSCNDIMMQLAARLGTQKFSEFMRIFGFGSRTGIDLPGEADTKSLVHSAESMGSSDLATNSFGQNYNCTMIQMASAFCSVVNGGAYYEPHIVKQILNSKGAVVKDIEPKLVRETVSEHTSNFINEALRRTVEEGTGAAAKVAGYKVGGKTGTSEKYPRGRGNYLLSFAGIAPTDRPEVFCYVVVDEPHVEDQAHSSFASSIFSGIMSELLPYMNIFPETDIQAELGTENMPASEGISENVENSGQDSVVVEESPAPVYDTEEILEPISEQEEKLPGIPAGVEAEISTEIVVPQNETQ